METASRFTLFLITMFMLTSCQDGNPNTTSLANVTSDKRRNASASLDRITYLGSTAKTGSVISNDRTIHISDPDGTDLEFSLVVSVEAQSTPVILEDVTLEIYASSGAHRQFLTTITVLKNEISLKEAGPGDSYAFKVEKMFSIPVTRTLLKFLNQYDDVKLVAAKPKQFILDHSPETVSTEKTLPRFASIRQVLAVGQSTVNLRSLTYKRESASCGATNPAGNSVYYALFDAQATWSPSSDFSSIDVSYADACFKLAYNASINQFEPTVVQGDGQINAAVQNNFTEVVITPPTIDDSPSDLTFDPNALEDTLELDIVQDVYVLSPPKPVDVSIQLMSIDQSGNVLIGDVTVGLPRGHGFHGETNNVVDAAGRRSAAFRPATQSMPLDGDWSTLTLIPKQTTYLHAPGLPFYIALPERISFKSPFLSLSGATARYVHDHLSDVVSNDVKFDKPSEPFTLTLDRNGIDSSKIDFRSNGLLVPGGGALPQTHFPRMTLNGNRDFSIRLENSTIIPTTVSDESIMLEYAGECPDNRCETTANATAQQIPLTPKTTVMHSDGALAAVIDSVGSVKWGMKDPSSDATVFQRNDAVAGMLYVPGFQIAADDPGALTDYLLGSRSVKKGASVMRLGKSYALHHAEAKQGNHYFAGITVGPETLADANGQVAVGDYGSTLTGMPMDIAVGAAFSDPLQISSNDGSKYYLRPSGVTGVFNSDYSDSKQIYGYDMRFKRFAFAQRNNVLDDATWIDGAIEVKGNGGFAIDFESLAMDCMGGLSRGGIAKKDCQNDVNCNQSLRAWKIPMYLVAMQFNTVDGSDRCQVKKELEVSSILNVLALKNRLGLKAVWSRDGVAKNAVMTGRTDNVLDANESEQGHVVALDTHTELKANDAQAWIETSVDVALPFWERMPTKLRAVNKTLDRRDVSVLARSQDYSKLDMTRTNSALLSNISSKEYNLSAVYKWGSTGIEFGFPVYYDAKTEGTPTFIGRKLEYDLKVLSANAGINFITPVSTKVSFGASADFKSLKELKLHVDLNDPKSLKEIDGFLAGFGITGNPLQSTIGTVVAPLHFTNQLVDKGLNLAIEHGAILALKQLPSEYDPFLAIAQSSTKVHSLPAVIIDGVTAGVVTGITQHAVTTFKSLDQNYDSACKNGSQKSALAQLEKDLGAIDASINDLNNVKKMLKDIEAVLKVTAEVATAIRDINKTLTSFFVADEEIGEQCSLDNIHPDGFLKPVGDTVKTMNDVNEKIKKIDIDKIGKMVQSASKLVKLDTKEVKDAIKKLTKFSKFLQTKLDKSTTDFKAFFKKDVCPGIKTIQKQMAPIYDVSQKVDEANAFILTRVQSVQSQLSSGQIPDQIDLLRSTVKVARATLNDGTMRCDQNLSTQLFAGYKSTQFANFKGYREALRDLNVQAKQAVKQFDTKPKLFQQVPNANADGYRKMVVVAMMNSQPIAALRKGANGLISPVTDQINGVAVQMLSVINKVVNSTLAAVSSGVNDTLKAATGVVKQLPIDSAKMDGYALIMGDELERMHIDASWSVGASKKDKKASKKTAYSFEGSFDMARWSSNGKTGCGGGSSHDSNIDVTIGTRNIGLKLGKKEFMIDELGFGFTLDGAVPIGVNGGITSKKGFDFEKFKLYDMGLFVGIGAIETYLGAKTAAMFEKYQLQAAFLFGQTCGRTVIVKLDPEVGKFITLPNNRFNGIYVRGGASFPIYNVGCALTVGVGANLGVWYLVGPPQTYGGIVGGEAYGQAACIASLKGVIKALFEKSGEQVKFAGIGWGAAGLGFCEPETWKSVEKVRKDDWCGTGDATFAVQYTDNKWHVDDIKASAID